VAGADQLLVRCGGALCALEVAVVREVIRPLPYAELPRMPEFVIGAVNHRSEAFPVIDLARLLGLGPSEASTSARVVVVQLPRGRLGVLVDRVDGVRVNPEARLVDLEASLTDGWARSARDPSSSRT
jgi:chemotaxis signal transduction protein